MKDMPSDLAFYQQNAFLRWLSKKFPEKFSPPLTCGFVDFLEKSTRQGLRGARKGVD